MLRILPIGLIICLGGFLLKALTSPSRKVICCAFLSNVLNHMRQSVLLQEVKFFSIFLLNVLENQALVITHSAVLLVIFESTSQVFQPTFCHTCQADKDSVCNVGANAIYEGRFSREKIYNTWNNALIYR